LRVVEKDDWSNDLLVWMLFSDKESVAITGTDQSQSSSFR